MRPQFVSTFALILGVGLGATACGDDAHATTPDAASWAPDDGPLPECDTLPGCEANDMLCTRGGRCTCTETDGTVVQCQRMPSGFPHPDAGSGSG